MAKPQGKYMNVWKCNFVLTGIESMLERYVYDTSCLSDRLHQRSNASTQDKTQGQTRDVNQSKQGDKGNVHGKDGESRREEDTRKVSSA